MSEIVQVDPYKILQLVKQNIESNADIKTKTSIGYVTQSMLEQAQADRIFLTPVADYVVSRGLSEASIAEVKQFSYSITLMLKSRAGEFPFEKFIDLRWKCIQEAYRSNITGVGRQRPVMSQETRTYFDYEINNNILSDMWICRIDITCNLK